MNLATTQKWSRFGWAALTYLVVFLLIFPVLWMVITGFKTEVAAIAIPPTLLFAPTLSQFALAISSGFGAYLFNSAVASLVSTALALSLGIPAAYAMVFQMRKKSADDMLFFVLSTRFMPFAADPYPSLRHYLGSQSAGQPLHAHHCLHGNESAADDLDVPLLLYGPAKRGTGGSLVGWSYNVADNAQGSCADGSARIGCGGVARHHLRMERFLFCRDLDLHQLSHVAYYGCNLYEQRRSLPG